MEKMDIIIGLLGMIVIISFATFLEIKNIVKEHKDNQINK